MCNSVTLIVTSALRTTRFPENFGICESSHVKKIVYKYMFTEKLALKKRVYCKLPNKSV